MNETFTFNDVDPDGGEYNGGYYNSYREQFIDEINDGEYDKLLKNNPPYECEKWIDGIYDYYGYKCGDIALKRALKLNKDYAMWSERRNKTENNLSFNDYRSPNFYKGPRHYSTKTSPTPFGKEDFFKTAHKYGEQPEHLQRPDVRDVFNYPRERGDVDRLVDYAVNRQSHEEYLENPKRAYDDWKIKHMYNGRNPDTQKLHTKGSLNRDLRAMDKFKK